MRNFGINMTSGTQFLKSLIIILIGICPITGYTEIIRAAVASNFSVPMKVIASAFEKQTGHSVQLATGSSGKFYAQIMNGAPFDLLLSADSVIPEKLEKAEKTVIGSRFIYASGRLVLWSRKEDYIDNNSDRLKFNNFSKLSMANPRLAPYGIAAKEVLIFFEL